MKSFFRIVALSAAAALAGAPAIAATNLPLGAIAGQISATSTPAEIADLVASSDASLAPSIIAAAIAAGLSPTAILTALLARAPQPTDVNSYNLSDAVAYVVEAAPTQAASIALAAAEAVGAEFGGANDADDAAAIDAIGDGVLAGLDAAYGEGTEDYNLQAAAAGAELLPFLGEEAREQLADALKGEDIETAATQFGSPGSAVTGRPSASGNPSAN